MNDEPERKRERITQRKRARPVCMGVPCMCVCVCVGVNCFWGRLCIYYYIVSTLRMREGVNESASLVRTYEQNEESCC